ncbi:hypothetical protein MMC17_006880 [Xylographa soralifera]|nr:hypothetical protein [Xylographa soralifera]MCJ1383766.1 hypothetical protein [Xylographa soralifera]
MADNGYPTSGHLLGVLKKRMMSETHSGIFHFLPLGLRVQEKVEKLLDKHMIALGASKVSLSTFSSESLWQRSGRLTGDRSELFQLEDRKGTKFLLSPTHEEEITSLVANTVHSYKDLPLRLYQITRKYRDEPRPRQGLLRTREFLMKDLYTFDPSAKDALQTYHEVREAYSAFFDELKVPYLTAEADSGNIGGDLSHEYHMPSSKGEDRILSCSSCDYVANEEVARSGREPSSKKLYDIRKQAPTRMVEEILSFELFAQVHAWYSITHAFSRDRKIVYIAIYPSMVVHGHECEERATKFNLDALKSIFPNIDTTAGDLAETNSPRMKKKYVLDYRISEIIKKSYNEFLSTQRNVDVDFDDIPVVDLVMIEDGDGCPKCETGILKAHTSIELGHTFHLGTKYSKPLNAKVPGDSPSSGTVNNITTKGPVLEEKAEEISAEEVTENKIFLEMGCHGIGVSRLIAAVADSLADAKGLNWPRVMAPFEAVVISGPDFHDDAQMVMDALSQEATPTPSVSPRMSLAIDAILDDRPKPMAWKMKDADLIGYPVLVILGRSWRKEKKCEVQCRQLGFLRQDVALQELRSFVDDLLRQL